MSVNFIAVFISAIVSMVVGAVWYHPRVFGTAWLKYIDFTDKDKDEMNVVQTYGGMFVGALLMSYVLALFVTMTNAQTASDGAILGFWAWLGFVVPTGLGDVLFAGKKAKPWGIYLLQLGYNLTLLCVVGALLSIWR